MTAPEVELRAAWLQLGGSGHEHLLQQVLAHHREPHRRYHTAVHVMWVLRHIAELAAAQANDAVEKGDTPTTSSFAQLSVLQANIREPVMFASAGWFVPEAEMSGDAVEVLVQAVAGEDGK